MDAWREGGRQRIADVPYRLLIGAATNDPNIDLHKNSVHPWQASTGVALGDFGDSDEDGG